MSDGSESHNEGQVVRDHSGQGWHEVEMMIQPVRVKLVRRAIRPADCVAVTVEQKAREVDVLKQANGLIFGWSKLMISDEIEIVDVEVTYADGKVLRDRYELRYGNRDWDLLGDHLQMVLKTHAGEQKPGHLTESQYVEVLAGNQKRTDRARQWLAGYRIWERLL